MALVSSNTMTSYDQIMKLALERGFYFPSCEIYADAPAGFWEYGPVGVNMKNKFIALWRRELIRRDGMMEIDGSQIMSRSVFDASGHLRNFSDPLVECKKCGSIFRADRYLSERMGKPVLEGTSEMVLNSMINKNQIRCQKCKGEFKPVTRFNMMFKVGIGSSHDEAYLRPETCQTIFVDFARVFKTMRGKLPLGIAQIGKSFRNEIAPRQSLLRLREFYQAEIEVFCNPNRLNELQKFDEVRQIKFNLLEDKYHRDVTADDYLRQGLVPNMLVAYYLALLTEFYSKTGIDMKRTRFRKLSDDEKAFYSHLAFDFEVETSTGWLELVACNYRADYDLKGHSSTSNRNFDVVEPTSQTKVLPHVFELSMGIDRSLYSILEHSYYEDFRHDDRVVLRLNSYLAPITIGVLPLMSKTDMVEKSKAIHSLLKRDFDSIYDESGSIGRRYRRLEEIGVPFAITVDPQTLVDNTVTVRYRDSMGQERVDVGDLKKFLEGKLAVN
jgi:glycyl-tRNA synthetase